MTVTQEAHTNNTNKKNKNKNEEKHKTVKTSALADLKKLAN